MAGRLVHRRAVFGALSLAVLVASVAIPPAQGRPRTERSASDEAHADPVTIDPAAPVTLAGMEIAKSFDPATYDGSELRTDATPDVTTGTRGQPGLPSVHAIYAHPRGTTSRFAPFAAMFQQDLRDASDLLLQSYGYRVRIDERTSPTHGPLVDITSVELAATHEQLADADALFSLVRSELLQKGFSDTNKKYVVWLDDDQNDYCGQATRALDDRRVAQNANQERSFALIYRPGDPGGRSGGFCRSATVLHELGHAFGALLPAAPNDFDGAHCDDAENDIMCYSYLSRLHTDAPDREEDPRGYAEALVANAPKYTVRNPGPVAAVFDHNNDDYWDPAAKPSLQSTTTLPWWTVNLNRFLCPPSGCTTANQPFGPGSKSRKR